MMNKSQDWIENNSPWQVGGPHPPWEICKKSSVLVKEYVPMRPHYHVVVMLINLSYARQWLGGSLVGWWVGVIHSQKGGACGPGRCIAMFCSAMQWKNVTRCCMRGKSFLRTRTPPPTHPPILISVITKDIRYNTNRL